MDVITYDTGRRKASGPGSQPAATRGRILDAARDLLLTRHHADFSVAEVARAAGVAHRTVYRYFADKAALIAAVAERPTDGVPGLEWPETWADARHSLRRFWSFFGDHLDDLRAERLIPAGLELRRARLARGRELVRKLLPGAGVRDESALERLTEVVVLLTSSGSLLELVDRHGLSVEAATDLVVEAVDQLVSAASEDST
jgi:AcrR family transcriptional regulator